MVGWYEERTAPALTGDDRSVLEALDDSRVMYISLKKGFIEIGESCDGYFRRALSKEQFGRLIAELLDIQKRLESQ